MSQPLHRTMFDTPVVSTVLRLIARLILRLKGWKYVGGLPAGTTKCVMIAAPHTSNWDLPYTLMIAFALRVNIHWMGKDTIFRAPFGGLMRWMGGIPVDRARAGDVVAASIETLRNASSLVLVVAPQGSRSHVPYWKTGFYRIAHGAGVPIMMGYLDFAKKEGGIARMFETSGDIESDMREIQDFYATVTGCKPHP